MTNEQIALAEIKGRAEFLKEQTIPEIIKCINEDNGTFALKYLKSLAETIDRIIEAFETFIKDGFVWDIILN